MTTHGSASPLQQKSPINNADLKRRARLLAVDSRVDHGTRGLLRMALEMKDPCLGQLVTRVESGETHIEHLILDDD